MDIRDKLLQTVDPNDSQFKVLLNNALQTEITALEEELRGRIIFENSSQLYFIIIS